MSFFDKLFSGGASNLVDSVGKLLDEVVTTKEEKQQLLNELQKSQHQFELDFKKLSNEEKQMIIADTANARQREATVQTNEQSTRLNKNITPYLALGTVGLTLILFYVLIFRPGTIPDSTKDIILYILGVLSAILTQIYSYYFGSSSGSVKKSESLASIYEKNG